MLAPLLAVLLVTFPILQGQFKGQTIVSCPPMVVPNQNYMFKPTLKLYQSSAEQGGSLFIEGSGFTPNGTTNLHVDNLGETSAVVLTYPTDRNGSFLETFDIDSNMEVGTYIVWGHDNATGVATNILNLKVAPANPFTLKVEGLHWRWIFHSQSFYDEHYTAIQSLVAFADKTYDQYAHDFGFVVGRLIVDVTHETDNISGLYVGTASSAGVAFSANLVNNDYLARSFISHEMANIFQGNVTAGWPWADGRGIWMDLSKAG